MRHALRITIHGETYAHSYIVKSLFSWGGRQMYVDLNDEEHYFHATDVSGRPAPFTIEVLHSPEWVPCDGCGREVVRYEDEDGATHQDDCPEGCDDPAVVRLPGGRQIVTTRGSLRNLVDGYLLRRCYIDPYDGWREDFHADI